MDKGFVYKGFVFIKHKFWPLSAILFGPWHALVLLALVSRLTAGTAIGVYILAHYNTLRAVLMLLFSLYFVLALMMWIVGRQPQSQGMGDQRSTLVSPQITGLSTTQILGWGFLGMALIPVLVALSTLTYWDYLAGAFTHIFRADATINTGFLWLISIATVIMTPIMVIWLVWMWQAWSRREDLRDDLESQEYEYE